MDERRTFNNFGHSTNCASNLLTTSFHQQQRLCLSNPASARGSPERSQLTVGGRIGGGMFSPPVTRRPPIVPRQQAQLRVYSGGSSGAFSSQQPHCSLGGAMPSTSYDQQHQYVGLSGATYRGCGLDDLLLHNASAMASSRRSALNRMRQHRSLEGESIPYFDVSTGLTSGMSVPGGSYFSTDGAPPADPHSRPSPLCGASAGHLSSPRYFSSQPSTIGTGYYGAAGQSAGTGVGYSGGLLTGLGRSADSYGATSTLFGGDDYSRSKSLSARGYSGQYSSNTGIGIGQQQPGTSLMTGGYHGAGFPFSSSAMMGGGNLGGGFQQAGMIGGTGADGPASFPVSQPLTISTNPHQQQQTVGMGALSGPASYYNFFANRDPYSMSMPTLQREFEVLKREYESVVQKLNSSMNSIKAFWSPELKKERAMRKEEASKLALMQEQLKMSSQENQKQSSHIRQLQDELQCQYELSRTIRDTEIQSVPKDEYEALRLERDRLHRELVLSKDTLREFEVQIETQRQTLASRDDSVKKLLDMLQSKGLISYSGAQERLELEHCRSRMIELENRCKNAENVALQKDQDVRTLREECLLASHKLRQLQMQYDRYQRLPVDEREIGALQALLDTKMIRIEQLEQRILLYEDEIAKLREQRLSMPRNFTDKSVSDMEYQEMKLKMEKLQLELSQKQSEFVNLQTKLVTCEEQGADAKKQHELFKETIANREQHIVQLQSDIEALRAKLETRTETIEQKTQQIQTLQHERNRLQSDIFDLNEQLKIRDSKLASLQRKIDNCDEMLKDKDHQLEMTKQRLAASPAMIQQKQFQEQVDELMRERDRLLQQLREQRDRVESERFEELELHRNEVRNLRLCIESLQKEIADRQVLIESQNEKISDLNRDLVVLKAENKRFLERGVGGENYYVRETERLTRELQEARNEVDRLLKIIQVTEREKENLNAQIKEMERQSEVTKTYSVAGATPYSMSSLERRKVTGTLEEYRKRGVDVQNVLTQREQRVEELEEALKESVSITAERELAIAQQKQMTQQLEVKLNQYKDQLNRVQRQYDEMNGKLSNLHRDRHDKESLIRSLKHERKKHLEEVLQLKEEALLAAISEKDAHMALLENSPSKNADEIATLRKHKDKLIKKLKEENVRRMKLVNEQNELAAYTASVAVLGKELKASPVDQEDDAEGIWA